jgi:hypothetical protein
MDDWEWEFFIGRWEGLEYPKPEDYMSLTDDELREGTARARSEKIKGIRRWPSPLSEKQRWCLAFWIAENEAQYV